MLADNLTRHTTDARDEVRCNREALRQSIDAAWSRLIHAGGDVGEGDVSRAEAGGADQGEAPAADRDATPPRAR
jgi:hypothetical protein